MRKNGAIAWRELMTNDVGAARAFYETLFPWRFVDAPEHVGGEHAWIEVSGRRIGAIWKSAQPSAWLSFATVADVEAAAARMREAGGSVPIGPAPYPGLGTYAVLEDVEGARLLAMRWDTGVDVEDDARPSAGDFVWQTLGAREIEAAAARFAVAIGWDREPGPDGVLLVASGVPVAEVHALRGPSSRWVPYVLVEDVAETLSRAAGAGGRIASPARPIEGGGTAGVLVDPTGAVLALLAR
jgi:predicted enzyme related to lactoylglutathione lyase